MIEREVVHPVLDGRPDVEASMVITVETAVSGLRLLDHPYYRGWQAGDLSREHLATYAQQYEHFESCIPEVLACTAARMTAGPARQMVEANLQDELSNPRPHLDLLGQFRAAVGGCEAISPTSATEQLVGLYRSAAELGTVPALAVIAAYEIQAGEIADTKAAALIDHYDLPQAGVEFWSVHAQVEHDHAAWTAKALEGVHAPQQEVHQWARRSAEAWWNFLDDREAERAA